MKRIPMVLFAFIFLCVCCGMKVPDSVEEKQKGDEVEIVKTYTLSPDEDPELLIEEPFEQDGFTYTYESMVQSEEVHEQSKLAEKTLTFETDTDSLEDILPDIPGSVSYDGEDGYEGELILNTSSISTEAAGYATSSYTVSDTKTYTDLAYNDPSLIPQTVQKSGMTLSLSSVSWQGDGGTGANGTLIPTSYTATAYYSAVGSRTYATGYVTTARYSGDVTMTEKQITYTVTYAGSPIVFEDEQEVPEPVQNNTLQIVLLILGIVIAAAVIAYIVISIIRDRRRRTPPGTGN
ncbi:MAG: hypothetical protein U0N62_07260 [Hydrogeniiclostridium sp.]